MNDSTAFSTRSVQTAIPGPRSQELQSRRENAIPKGVASQYPVFVDEARGAMIRDVDGNVLIDLSSGIGVTTVGHCHPKVVERAQQQLEKYIHTLFTVAPYEPYVELGELVAAHTPGDFPKKTMFVNSGAEAVENAVKIARAATGRKAIAVLDHAFHGRTNLTMTMNHKASYATGMGPLATDVHHAPSSYPFRDGLSGEQAAARTIDYLEKRIGAQDLACLVVEPIQGEGGFMVPAEGYLNRLVDWCRENGVVFVADEIQSGMARTGKYFACEHFGIEPDLITFAKGIADGMPLAGVTGRAEIMDGPMPGRLGGTFAGNPVALSAGIAVFEAIEQENLLESANRVGEQVTSFFEGLRDEHDIIGDIRGHGAMIAVEFVKPGTAETTKEPNKDVVSHIVKEAFANGVIVLSCGTWENVIRFLPPVVITEEQLADALSVIADAIKSF